jgi:hypothetical protein
VFGPEVLKDVERQVQMIRESLKIAQLRQKSYADKRRRDLSFNVGEEPPKKTVLSLQASKAHIF